MNQHLKTIFDFIQQNENLAGDEKTSLTKLVTDADKEFEITAFKLDQTEKEKHTTAILLEETIEELEQKRKAVEAQNRELEIEAALERVRSRAMSMNKSEELQEVISDVFVQMQNLGIKADASLINILTEESKDFYLWIGTVGQTYAQKIRIPYIKHPVFDVFYEAHERGETFMTNLLTRAEKDSFFEYAFKYSDLKLMPDARKKYVMDSAGFARSFAWSKNSGITIQNYAGIPYSNQENEILKRFAQVFEQAYTRFLDVKNAEMQARKAQIESAMEKVRSRSLAMRNTTELTEVLAVVYDKLIELKVDFNSANILIFSEHTKDIEYWTINNAQQKFLQFNIPYADYSVPRFIINARENKQDLLELNFQGKEHDELLHYLFEQSDFKKLPEERKKILKESGNYTLSLGIGNRIGIQINSYYRKSFSEEENEILKRFTSVFEQAFIRFLDLQKAEIQALEVIKQASLDRVRGEIASMRTKDDLNRITPLIWKELKTLGVPFVRCGVFIMDETNEHLHTFLSTPNGEAIAAFHIPYNTPGNFAEIVNHWKKNMSYVHQWDEKDFQNLAVILLQKGSITSQKQYLSSLPKGIIHLHFLPFLQGMFYVGNDSQLNSDQLQVVQTLANAFSTAYARYEDFNKLESAKEQIERTLTELKSTQAQLIHAEKMASLGELTAGIAHEIQNPLNFVNNFSEISNELVEEFKSEKAKGKSERDEVLEDELLNDISQNLEKITQHGKRASSIVKGMLEHSRTGEQKKELTDINKLADEFLRLAYHGFKAKDKSFNVVLKTHFEPDLPKINVIPQDIGRVLLNLINNAFYAVDKKTKDLTPQSSRSLGTGPEGGAKNDQIKYVPTIIVSTTSSKSPSELVPKNREDLGVKISVKDNGDGISSNIVDKIFQPFFTTKPTGQGTGLGLSLSYDIVKAHGGDIKVVSEEGNSTEFILLLPI